MNGFYTVTKNGVIINAFHDIEYGGWEKARELAFKEGFRLVDDDQKGVKIYRVTKNLIHDFTETG